MIGIRVVVFHHGELGHLSWSRRDECHRNRRGSRCRFLGLDSFPSLFFEVVEANINGVNFGDPKESTDPFLHITESTFVENSGEICKKQQPVLLNSRLFHSVLSKYNHAPQALRPTIGGQGRTAAYLVNSTISTKYQYSHSIAVPFSGPCRVTMPYSCLGTLAHLDCLLSQLRFSVEQQLGGDHIQNIMPKNGQAFVVLVRGITGPP